MNRQVIGLIPAAGQATRISPLPCSKELFPVGFRIDHHSGELRPKVACHYLLEQMRLAGIAKAYIILRNGKWDIPAYLGDGTMLDMHLGYLMMRLPYGQPYTLDQAYPFIRDANIALGFPDIIFQAPDAFNQLIARQRSTGADIVLGLFRANRPSNSDMVELSNNGRIRSLSIKPVTTDLIYTWILAIWTPTFTSFMHDYVVAMGTRSKDNPSSGPDQPRRELFVGDVVQAAIENELRVEGLLFPEGKYLDIGTPEDLLEVSNVTQPA